MQTQIEVTEKAYRSEVVVLLKRGADKFKMSAQTVHLALCYYDTLMAKNRDLNRLISTKWQLQAVTCLILACKFNERDDNVPLIQELIRVMLQQKVVLRSIITVTYEQVYSNELEVMARLEWDLFRVTTVNFLDNFCT